MRLITPLDILPLFLLSHIRLTLLFYSFLKPPLPKALTPVLVIWLDEILSYSPSEGFFLDAVLVLSQSKVVSRNSNISCESKYKLLLHNHLSISFLHYVAHAHNTGGSGTQLFQRSAWIKKASQERWSRKSTVLLIRKYNRHSNLLKSCLSIDKTSMNHIIHSK